MDGKDEKKDKKKDFYAVVKAIVKFIEVSDNKHDDEASN